MGHPGRRGVPHAEFPAGWDGHRLRTPALPASLVEDPERDDVRRTQWGGHLTEAAEG